MVPTQNGGRIRKMKKVKKTHVWVSTGRKTTLKDGRKRTVYKCAVTGQTSVKSVPVRNGKRVAVYTRIRTL